MDKRIVICCDGTGNELNRTMSNVLKFYRILEKTRSNRFSIRRESVRWGWIILGNGLNSSVVYY